MIMLSKSDAARLLAAVQQAHAHTDFSTLPALMVALQSELIPNDVSAYTLMDKRLQRAEVVQSQRDIDVEKSRPQFMAYYHEHPVVQHCHRG